MRRQAVFLDKDGTLVEDVPFNVDPARVTFMDGAFSALRRLRSLGYLLIVITNQPGIGEGRFSEKAYLELQEYLQQQLSAAGLPDVVFFYCPHKREAGCSCRKPEAGLLFRAASELGVSPEHSWFIGDILDDIEAAHRAGARAILLNNGNESEWDLSHSLRIPDYLADTLESAAVTVARADSFELPALPRRAELRSTQFGRWQAARNVLAIRLDAMGDVLMTSPALRALKESRKDRCLTLLTSKSGASAWPLLPWIDQVMAEEAPWMKSRAEPVTSQWYFTLAEQIRSRHFDAAVIFTVYSQSSFPAAFLCALADIPLTLGYARENPYQLLSDWVSEPEPRKLLRHEVMRQLHLVRHVGATTADESLRVIIPAHAITHAEAILKFNNVKEQEVVIVLHPGASAPSRRYRPDYFGVVAEMLLEAGYRVAVTGDDRETPIIDEVINRIAPDLRRRIMRLSGALSLEALAALLRRASLLVSNNTGPVHLAAAVGTPVVDLYALTNPQHTPWGVASRVLFHEVPCKYCYKSVCPETHHLCLDGLPPHQVARACFQLLESNCSTGFRRGSPLENSIRW